MKILGKKKFKAKKEGFNYNRAIRYLLAEMEAGDIMGGGDVGYGAPDTQTDSSYAPGDYRLPFLFPGIRKRNQGPLFGSKRRKKRRANRRVKKSNIKG